MTTRANLLARQELIRLSAARATEPDTATRHKCFLAHHAADAEEVLDFVERFGNVIIPRSIGVTDDDDFIESDDDDYVMSRIRQDYLGSTTVTIVLLGKCTWARKYIDWEVYSSLRLSKHSTRNGLMGIRLASGEGALRPPRLEANLAEGDKDGYARSWTYPASDASLRSSVEDAFDARATRAHLIKPAAARRRHNSPCA